MVVTKKVKVTPPGSNKPIIVTVQETEPPKKPWSDWINITGNLQGYLSHLRATNNADGRIVLSGIYFNYIPWVSQQKSDNPFDQESWTDWVTPDGNGYKNAALTTPILDKTGNVSIIQTSNEGLLRSRQTESGAGVWGPYSSPGFINDNLLNHASSIDADCHLAIAVLNNPAPAHKNFIYFTQQTNAENNQWTTWEILAMVDRATSLEMSYNANGSLTLFVFDDKTGDLFTLSQINADSTEWYQFPTQIGKNIKSFAVTRDLTVKLS